MNKLLSSLVMVVVCGMIAFAGPPNNYNLLIAPGTMGENEVTFLWDKQYGNNPVVYEILLNGKLQGSTEKN